jgi:hypothetical protein
LGQVRRARNASGTARLLTEVPSGEEELTVVRKPFVDPDKEIPKS